MILMASAVVGALVQLTVGLGAIQLGVNIALSTVLFNAGFTLVAGGLASLLAEDRPTTGFDQELQRRVRMSKQSNAPRRVIYGQAKVSGPIAFMEATNNDEHLHLVVLLAGHECDSIDKVFLDGTELKLSGTSPQNTKYDDKVDVHKHLGTDSQSADSNLTSRVKEWTSDHRLRGICYLYVRMKYTEIDDREIYPGGIPEIQAVVTGKNDIDDPRDNSTGHTNNPALIINDYLQDSDIGMGVPASQVDTASVKTAATVCDENVSGENRYDCNGTFTLDKRPKEIMDGLSSSMGGQITWSEGQFRVLAGEFRSVDSRNEYDESDLAGPLEVTTKMPRDQIFNAVRGQYVEPDEKWTLTNFPPITNATFETEDGNERIWREITLPFTTSSDQAQRLAEIALRRSREQIQVSAVFNLSALEAQVGDNIKLTVDRYDWTDKVFEVKDWRLATKGGGGENESPTIVIHVELRENDSTVYSDQSLAVLTTKNPILSFDGSNDNVNFGDVHDASTLGTMTVEGWILPDRRAAGTQVFFGKDNEYQLRYNSDGELEARLYDSGNSTWRTAAGPTLPDGRWRHVALRWDGTNLDLFLDGTKERSTQPTVTLNSTSNNLRAGSDSSGSGSNFAGDLDDWRVWSDARTDNEIDTNRFNELGGGESNLSGYWKFNDGSGSTATDSAGNNDGTVNGATWETRQLNAAVGPIVSPTDGIKKPHPNLNATSGGLVSLRSETDRRDVFDTAGTHTFVHPDVDTVFVTLLGGGGGGGGGNEDGAGGGGASGEDRQLVPVSSFAAGDIIDVTVGSGGSGGNGETTSNGGDGTDGGDSSFGNAVTVSGGPGGTGAGTLNNPGDGGDSADALSDYDGEDGGSGANGGGNLWGAGGTVNTANGGEDGGDGDGPGTGGAGGAAQGITASGGDGGNGQDGLVIIEW